jgi:CBS domain-containing protein
MLLDTKASSIRVNKGDGTSNYCIHSSDLAKWLKETISREQGSLSAEEFSALSEKMKQMTADSLAKAVNYSKDWKTSTPVSDLVMEMMKIHPHNHISVTNTAGEQVSGVSMRDIILEVAKQQEKPCKSWIACTPIQSVGLGTHRIATVPKSTPVLDILRMMSPEITVVALTEDSKVVTGFGPSDFLPMFLNDANLEQLNFNAYAYLEAVGRVTEPVMVNPDGTLEDLINAFAANPVHCVFLGTDGTPSSIVTCSDLMHMLGTRQIGCPPDECATKDCTAPC